MSIILAVIIGIALPAMVQQVPAAERKSKKRGTASTIQSVGSAAGIKGNLLVPKALVSAFRACAEAQKARLVAKLKTAKSTQRLLLQIRKRLPSASDPDKRMIAAALGSLFPPMIPGAPVDDQSRRGSKFRDITDGTSSTQLESGLGRGGIDYAKHAGKDNEIHNLMAVMKANLRETSNMIESTQRELDSLIAVILLVKPAPETHK